MFFRKAGPSGRTAELRPSRSVRPVRLLVTALAGLLAASAAHAGPPFVTDDADSPDKGHFEINFSLQYTRVQGGAFGTAPSVEANYGVTDKLQVAVMLPVAFAQTNGTGANFGVGDIEVGAKYRFVEADDWGWRPGIAFAPTLIAPSGSDVRGLGAGRTQAFLPVWVSKDFNQWTLFGGGGYNINPGPDKLNWWFAGLGVARELSPKWTVGIEAYDATAAERGDRNSVGFNVGGIYNVSEMHHLMVSVGRNVVNGAANQLSTYVGYQLTF